MTTTTTKKTALELEPAPTPTPASAFRRAGLYRLPGSGHTVRLRWPGLRALALAGEITNPLAQSLRRLLAGADATREQPDETAAIELWRTNSTAFLVVAERCLDEPRLILDRSPDYERGEIGPGDLAEPDIIWLWIWATEGPSDPRVSPFRLDGGGAA